MLTILLLSLLTGSPEVTIVDEHRKDGGPTEVKITLTNKTKERLLISFQPDWYMEYFVFRFFDERGRPLKLDYTEGPHDIESPKLLEWPKAGEAVTGYLSPKIDDVIPPGRYQVELVYYYRVPGRNRRREIEEIASNRISKLFP